jgi:hypothetical protein
LPTKPLYIVDYLLELIIKIWLFGIFFSLKYDELGPFYFHEKSFAFVAIIFFRLKFASKRNNVPYISRSLGCRAHGGGRAPANHELLNQACADTNYFI